MKTYFGYGAMYAEVERGDQIEEIPIPLGDAILYPGEFVQRLGEKARTSFEMNDSYYLRFLGVVEENDKKVLLFDVNQSERERLCFAFHYVDRNTLVIGGPKGCSNIVINRLKKFSKLPEDGVELESFQQLSLF